MEERSCETCDNHDDNGLSGENACSLSRSWRVSCYYGRRQHWEPSLAHMTAGLDALDEYLGKDTPPAPCGEEG